MSLSRQSAQAVDPLPPLDLSGYSQGQPDSKNGAIRAVSVVDLDLTVMRLNDCSDDRKAHAHAVLLRGEKRVENFLGSFPG